MFLSKPASRDKIVQEPGDVVPVLALVEEICPHTCFSICKIVSRNSRFKCI